MEKTLRCLAGDPTSHRLLFVAEHAGEIAGISSIIPRLGVDRPFYSFKRSRHTRHASRPKLTVTYETLQLTTDFDGYTELATLYVAPQARGSGFARLLSLGRLAYIANHRTAFDDRLMADIRGWFDADGESPFWTHLTSKFIDVPYDQADKLCMNDGHFIDQLLPSLPIFLNLLPETVSRCVGRPNDNSAGAVKLLEGTGFRRTDLCDVFDGGPSMVCETDRTLIARTVTAVQGVTAAALQSALVFGGQGADFRATIGLADWGSQRVSRDVVDELATEILTMARIDAEVMP
ncbi:hypothetical protein ABAC402_15015 [Asticcacaulis sp. AC402]|nr:hypothetical protein ABAC402_15015 [Asticcacaulis sp. AC402]